MTYSWYDDCYKQTLRNIGRFCEPHVKAGHSLSGWMEWFEQTHPEIYKKFTALEERMDELWNQLGDHAMTTFKELCTQYEHTHRWVIGEFVKAAK